MNIPVVTPIITFLQRTAQELKKVTWLSRKDTVNYSIIVILVLIFGTLFVFGVDTLFTEVRSEILLTDF